MSFPQWPRPVQDGADIRQMQALAETFPEQTVHVTDLPYRLSAPSLFTDPEADTALWFDDQGDSPGDNQSSGRLLAWAVWQAGWVTLDYACHPAHARSLGAEVLAWGEARFTAIAQQREQRLPYWVAVRSGDQERIALLAQAGFQRRDWTTVRQQRPLQGALAAAVPEAPELPPGFTVRPLHGDQQVEAYVTAHRAAFGSTRMTVEWRQRVLRLPEYRPDLDLVVEAPDGRIAAFTIIWLSRCNGNGVAEAAGHLDEGQFEPVGTHPDFQRRGLARALLTEGIRRIAATGAAYAVVEADSYNAPARSLYESLMPVPGDTILHYAREF